MALRTDEPDLTSGSLFGKILIFALPIMAMNILQLLFNAADMVVVGRFAGSEALAAVGATGSLIGLIVNLFMGLSVGTSVVVAQDYGAGKREVVSRSVHTSIAVSIIGGFVVMILGLLLCSPLLRMMGTPDDILHLSELYMRIYFLGLPAGMVYNFGAAILRATGDSRRPMNYLTIAGVVNVVFNVVFVVGCHMNVAGVAWATVISQYLAVYLIINCLYHTDKAIRLIPRQIRIDRKRVKDIIRIGVPAGFQGMLFSISNVLIQSAVNSFGSTLVAASSASGNIESFAGTTMNAYYQAAVTFTGQSMGARKYDRIDAIAKVCTGLVFATWIILSGAVLFSGRPLLGIYTNNPEVIELGMVRMRIMMALYFTCGIMNVFPGLTRGMGYSVLPMLSTLVGACLLRIVWLMTVFKWYPTIPVLYACYPVTWTLAGLGQVASFFYARRQVRKKAALEGEFAPSLSVSV
ncbi:MAG TPA: MATE family efflux transporter [Limnochordia bacterium]|nr:MATE family efflux transporter [Bacillota bacterium]HKM17656.1 MATE family efflux transporter [Limnochordia bacterium]